ncbi:alpha/beta hydrolase [Ignatzschineria rhizosphaerae]|uniref:Alpha/beta hydrolase n=1 Tax=Ignatzschineria rhizosphaerae TaxID=2923279 RepID=A0ABY3X4A2_9GAMM|nr:alpha/beta hydrolase [Ignatzschineria rhizosphaerae]UNM95872.1 alpha/beta hydrolase [Ignatzschineria rhizosphaerae]
MSQVIDYQFARKSGIEYLEKKGEGKVFVLLHGISSGAFSWIKQLQDSTISHHLIAWNAPGYGESILLENPTAIGIDYAKRLLAFVDELKVDKFILVGHSLGAMMAAAFAAQYPERVSQLVLICAAQGYMHEGAATKLEIYERRPKLLAKLGNIGMANERGPFLLGVPTDENMEIVRTVSKGLTPQGFTNASHLLAYDQIDQSLPDVGCEIDLYYGEEDGITPPKGMFDLQEKFKKIVLHEVPNAGHLAYIDAPNYFRKTLFK